MLKNLLLLCGVAMMAAGCASGGPGAGSAARW